VVDTEAADIHSQTGNSATAVENKRILMIMESFEQIVGRQHQQCGLTVSVVIEGCACSACCRLVHNMLGLNAQDAHKAMPTTLLQLQSTQQLHTAGHATITTPATQTGCVHTTCMHAVNPQPTPQPDTVAGTCSTSSTQTKTKSCRCTSSTTVKTT
jgi:hypothetical protein